MHISIMLVFWSLVRNSVVLAVYFLFSVTCFFTVHEHCLAAHSIYQSDLQKCLGEEPDVSCTGNVGPFYPKKVTWKFKRPQDGKQDQIEDNMSSKEYKPPFKGKSRYIA